MTSHALDRDDAPLRTLAATPSFLDSLVEGLMLVDGAGVVLDCNSAAATMLAECASELVGRSVFDPELNPVGFDGQALGRDSHPLWRALNDGVGADGSIIGIDLAGSRRWLDLRCEPVSDSGGPGRVLIKFTDVTGLILRERNLRVLLGIKRLAETSTSVESFLTDVCEAFVSLARCVLCAVNVSSPREFGSLDVAYSAGATDFIYDGMGTWLGSREDGLGPTGTAMRTRVHQVVNDVLDHPGYGPWSERAREFGFRSVASFPLDFDGRAATLTLVSDHRYAFDELAVEGGLAAVAEIEFGIAHLRAGEKVAQGLTGTLSALGQMVEARDPFTAGHQLRVGRLAAAIASHLGLESRMVELIRQSGDVHDIGKISVAAEILTRPGPLNDLEREMVQLHTNLGYDVLTKASLPWPIALVAYQHHERVDGSGYPNGLTGEMISLPARIMAVADVVEAMTQHRPYRPARPLDEALDEIRRGAGKLYDADVVGACVAVFDGGFQLQD